MDRKRCLSFPANYFYPFRKNAYAKNIYDTNGTKGGYITRSDIFVPV